MRRMMHAAAILVAIASQIQAQSTPSPSSLEPPHSLRPEPTPSEEVREEQHIAAGNQLIHRDSGQSFSQLASYMSCSDWSPNLWNNYACERAAITARISQHVDMQCKCFESRHRLHAHGSTGGSCKDGSCGGQSCKHGTEAKRINRYRKPLSTLYTASSGSCDAACSTSTGCGTTGSSCNGGNAAFPSHPASAMRPMMANPPRDRVASPVVTNTKATFSVLNPEPSFAARR